MTDTDSRRLPLTTRRVISTFGIGVVGFMSANLVPYMILALQDSLEVGATEAGSLLTACLLATAVSCLLVTRFTEGRGRILIARVGLLATAAGFGVAAFDLGPALTIVGVLLGGIGAGGAVAAGGAALAALRNPNRVSGISGLTNRAIVSVVLAIIPLVGIAMGSAFGILAALALALFFTSAWLPVADTAAPPVDPAPTGAIVTTATGTERVRTPTRLITVAGIGLLVMFALWAVGEDSLWAMTGAIGLGQAGITEEQLGLVLSLSTAGGLLVSILLVIVGDRWGRALPLGVLLAAGGMTKLISATTTDPAVFMVVVIVWNTIYAAAFMFVIATAAALDASGRWSGPVLGVYLFGSAFAPLFGAWVGESFGFTALGWVLAGFSFALLVPMVAVARLSTQVEREQRLPEAASVEINTVRAAGI